MWNNKTHTPFESSVNSEGIETTINPDADIFQFESSVNSEGIETPKLNKRMKKMFESSVNSEGIETDNGYTIKSNRLRAV